MVDVDSPELDRILDGHRRLRSALDACAAGATSTAVVDLAWCLGEHRAAHDDVLFPALAARVDSIGPVLAALVEDHRSFEIVAARLVHAAADAAEIAADLRVRVLDHLSVESADVLPFLLRHVAPAELAALEAAAG